MADIISPAAVHLEQHNSKLQRAKQRLADRLERQSLEATIEASRQQVMEDEVKLDELIAGPEAKPANGLDLFGYNGLDFDLDMFGSIQMG